MNALVADNVIGASLSDPQTSVAALHTWVCMSAAIYQNLVSTFKFLILRRPSSGVSAKPEGARVQRRLPGVEMTEVEVHMATYSRR